MLQPTQTFFRVLSSAECPNGPDDRRAYFYAEYRGKFQSLNALHPPTELLGIPA